MLLLLQVASDVSWVLRLPGNKCAGQKAQQPPSLRSPGAFPGPLDDFRLRDGSLPAQGLCHSLSSEGRRVPATRFTPPPSPPDPQPSCSGVFSQEAAPHAVVREVPCEAGSPSRQCPTSGRSLVTVPPPVGGEQEGAPQSCLHRLGNAVGRKAGPGACQTPVLPRANRKNLGGQFSQLSK